MFIMNKTLSSIKKTAVKLSQFIGYLQSFNTTKKG